MPRGRSGFKSNAIGAASASRDVRQLPHIMPQHTLYAYVDGADLDGIADALDARFAEFVEGRQWVAGRASVVNQRHGHETCSQPGDLPLWDLGLNLELPHPDRE